MKKLKIKNNLKMTATLEDIFALSEKELTNEIIKYNNRLKRKDLENKSLLDKQVLLINYYNSNKLFNEIDQELTKNIYYYFIKDKMNGKDVSYLRLLLEDLYERSNKELNTADFKTIKINTDFLYHTTLIYNEETKDEWDEMYEENKIPLPKFGSYHTSYNDPKFFTITPLANYRSSENHVFLKYKLKSNSIMKLLDIREVYDRECFINHNLTEYDDRSKILEESGFDGYIGKEDSHEILLVHPEKFIESFEEIDFVDSDLPLEEINEDAFSHLVLL